MVFIIWWFSGPLAWGSLISVSIFRILSPPTPGTPCKSTFHFHTWRMYAMFPASWVWSGRRTGQGTGYLSFITIVTYSPCFNSVPPRIYLERDLLFYPFQNRRPSSSVRAWEEWSLKYAESRRENRGPIAFQTDFKPIVPVLWPCHLLHIHKYLVLQSEAFDGVKERCCTVSRISSLF